MGFMEFDIVISGDLVGDSNLFVVLKSVLLSS